MSQAERSAASRPTPDRSCWLVLGARELRWGEVDRRASPPQWLELGSVALPDEGRRTRQNLVQALTALLPAQPFSSVAAGTPLHVWMDDVWVPMGMVPWSDVLADDRSATASARFALVELGHDLGPADQLRLDDMPWGQPRLAVAYPGEVLAWLEERASAWGLSLAGVHAGSIACWGAVARHSSAPALAVLTDESLVFMGAPSGARRLTGFHPLAVEDGAALSRAWCRLSVRHPLWEGVTQVVLVNAATEGRPLGELPLPFRAMGGVAAAGGNGAREQGLPDLLVALSAAASPHALSWRLKAQTTKPFLVLAAVALCLGLTATAAAMSQQLRSKAVLDEAMAGLVQRSGPAERELALTKQEVARIPLVNQAIRQLNLPVRGLLQALEPPRDLMVAVLSVDSVGQVAASGQSSSVRIVAQAPSSADMTRYVAFVGGRRPFTGAHLRKHEWVDASNKKRIRFTLEATWTE